MCLETLLDVTDCLPVLFACLFVTSVLMFHVGLEFIFCWRWQVVYVSLCSHAAVCVYPALQH